MYKNKWNQKTVAGSGKAETNQEKYIYKYTD